ncbi:MAG TPA: curli assembly protein CsgF [Bradyrhizobium sp.]|nr:curli assembly protein CsgF [Bradyrhizobium sp.]
MSNRHWAVMAIAAISISASAPAVASQLVYHPINPALGGNPLNGSSLLATAQAQGEGTKSGQQSPDLSGLDSALSNLGSGATIINTGSGSSGSSNSSGATP